MVDKEELHKIRRFTSRAEGTKAINTLKGIITGINLDNIINKTEVKELENWAKTHYDLIGVSPFNEIIPFVNKICEDGIITEEEFKDLCWLVDMILYRKGYYDLVTCKLQELEGIFHGVLADNNITDTEIKKLQDWLFDNEELIGTYPFDEIEALLFGITEDGVITEKERNYLKLFLSEFVNEKDSKTIDFNEINKLRNDITLSGVCTINPLIEFKDKMFCFTGISKKYKRKDIVEIIESRGGIYKDTVSDKTDFLIIGQDSNPCWAYSCYGRKVEKAMDMRKKGSKISIVKEIDFEDATIE
ncbi:MAG: BRCT domain-containing protein [Treponema sp.]